MNGMTPVRVQNLIMPRDAGPSILVLCPFAADGQPATNFVPIWIGTPEAAQIGLALEDVKFPRPLTHDLLIDALTNLDAYVDHVLITDVKDSTFFAKVTLRHHGRLIELDARPSDAVALALKQNAGIYLLDSLLDKASYPFMIPDQNSDEADIEAFHRFVTELTPDDFAS